MRTHLLDRHIPRVYVHIHATRTRCVITCMFIRVCLHRVLCYCITGLLMLDQQMECVSSSHLTASAYILLHNLCATQYEYTGVYMRDLRNIEFGACRLLWAHSLNLFSTKRTALYMWWSNASGLFEMSQRWKWSRIIMCVNACSIA